MDANQKGEIFMKQVTKAALSALFAIGVTSPQNIDKFIEHFSEELMKNYPDKTQTKTDKVEEDSIGGNPTPIASTPPQDSDINVIIKDEEILKILRAEGIDTLNQLSLTMQKKSLTEINGITGVVEDEIRESLKEWNKS